MSAPRTPFWSRLLGGLASASLAHPRRVIAGAVLLAAASLGLASARLTLKTSNLDLVDAEHPVVTRFLDFAEHFGSPNMLVVVFEADDAAAEPRLREAVDRTAARLAAVPGVRTVFGRLPYDPARLAELDVEAYFTSRDRRLFFVFVQPDDPRSRADTIAAFVGGVRRVLADAGLDALGVRAGLTGIPQYALDDREVIERDVSWLSTISFVAVLAILVLGFHALRRPLLAMVTLLFVAALVLGVAALVP